MSEFARHAVLSGYFAAYIGMAFGLRTYRVYKLTGRNPFVLAVGDDAEGYVGRAFVVAAVSSFVSVILPVFVPGSERWFGQLVWLRAFTAPVGSVLLAASMLLTLIAQSQMGRSWRIGIDHTSRTDLVEHGLLAWSRNPIFLSMRLTLLGLFCVIPSAATLGVLIAGEIPVQTQARLEEAYLAAIHGPAYAAYRSRVRRWLGRTTSAA